MAGHEETGTSGEEVLYTVSQTQHLMDPPQFVYQGSEWRSESQDLRQGFTSDFLSAINTVWCNFSFLADILVMTFHADAGQRTLRGERSEETL